MAAIENQEGTSDSDNNLSIVLSASESSVDREHDSSDNNEDEDSAENEKGLQPYRFEPYESDNEPNVGSDSPVSSDQDEGAVGGAVEENGFPEQDINRLQNTEWCHCGHCINMPTVIECTCCLESQNMIDEMRLVEGQQINCITDHPGFYTVCLDVWGLRTAYFAYRQEHGPLIGHPLNERYRYTAYRQLVRWCWGYLGRHIRVPLPSCAVHKIRKTFPGIDYEGFKLPIL